MGHCLYELIYHLVMVFGGHNFLTQALKRAQWLYGLSHHTQWNENTTQNKNNFMFLFYHGRLIQSCIRPPCKSISLVMVIPDCVFQYEFVQELMEERGISIHYMNAEAQGGTSCDALNCNTTTPLGDHLI